MPEKLTARQSVFVKEYLIDLNATQAAIRAGYSEETAGQAGSENLKKPQIAAAVQAGMDKRAVRTEINADYVLGIINETIARCRQVEPVRDRKGNQVWVDTPDGKVAPAFVFDAKNVLKGTELLGRHLKLFTDNVNVNHTGRVTLVDDVE